MNSNQALEQLDVHTVTEAGSLREGLSDARNQLHAEQAAAQLQLLEQEEQQQQLQTVEQHESDDDVSSDVDSADELEQSYSLKWQHLQRLVDAKVTPKSVTGMNTTAATQQQQQRCDFLFETSKATGRVHVYTAKDKPLCANVRPEALIRLVNCLQCSISSSSSSSNKRSSKKKHSKIIIHATVTKATVTAAADAKVQCAFEALPEQLQRSAHAIKSCFEYWQQYSELKSRQKGLLNGIASALPLSDTMDKLTVAKRAARSGADGQGVTQRYVSVTGAAAKLAAAATAAAIGTLDDSDSSVHGGYNSGGNDSDDAELDELLLTGNTQLSLYSSQQLPSQAVETREVELEVFGKTRTVTQRITTRTVTSNNSRSSSTTSGSSKTTSKGTSKKKTEVIPQCMLCSKATPCRTRPRAYRDLFCSGACYSSSSARSSSSGLRRAVQQRDSGVCDLCHLDTAAMLEAVKCHTTADERRAVLLQMDGRFGASLVLLDKLVRAPRAGNAWHADHVQAVYAGGGQCEIDNVSYTRHIASYYICMHATAQYKACYTAILCSCEHCMALMSICTPVLCCGAQRVHRSDSMWLHDYSM
eukprot:6260-Heterococcus_DN1.PRE.1